MINRLCLTFLVLSIDIIKQIVDTVIAATVEVITNTMMNRWFKTIYKKEQKILSLDRVCCK